MATAAPKHDRSKTAIIVGASRGLGLGLARKFARGGWHITATARNAKSILEGLDEMLTVNRLGLPLELRRALACTNAIENIEQPTLSSPGGMLV